MDTLDARKPLDFNLLRLLPVFLTDQNRFFPFLSKTFLQYCIKWFLIAVGQKSKLSTTQTTSA